MVNICFFGRQEPSCSLSKRQNIGQSLGMSAPVSSIPRWTHNRELHTKFIPVAHLRKLSECEQVAAICYRHRREDIEFLLVRTRSGKWIFPKGNAEPGLTHAQAAAIEAFEEAGVHGRMEEACFVRYTRRKRAARDSARSARSQVINAHLCEVLRLKPSPEAGRNPTWFSPQKAKRCLRQKRSNDYGTELAAVIDYAVARIRRPANRRDLTLDVGTKVRFIDALTPARMRKTSTRFLSP
jgi:8-oxo-dGTP pyrophosphatase MutT (NUDIX family)